MLVVFILENNNNLSYFTNIIIKDSLHGCPILVTKVTWPPGDIFTISPVARLVYSSPFDTWKASGPKNLPLNDLSALFKAPFGARGPTLGCKGVNLEK